MFDGAVEVLRARRVGVERPQLFKKDLPLLRVEPRVWMGLEFKIPETTHSRSWEEDQQHGDKED